MSQIYMLHRTGWLVILGFTLGILYSKITSSYSPEESRNSRDTRFPQKANPSSCADRIGDTGDAGPATSLNAVGSGDGGTTAETLPSTSDAEDDSATPKLKYFASPALTSQASILFAPDIAGANDGGADGHALTPVSGLAAGGLVINVATPAMVSDLVAPGAPRLGPVQLPILRPRRLPNVGPGDPLAAVQTDLQRSNPSGAGSTRPVNRMASSRLDTHGTSRKVVARVIPMSYPWDLDNQSDSYSSAPNRYTGSSTPGISKSFLYSQAGITIEQYTSDRFKITIACGNGNPDVGSLRDILKRHFPERGLLSLKLNLFLMDSLDEMCHGREIMERILIYASPMLRILYITIPDMGKFDSQLTARRLDNVAFPVLKSFTWSGHFEKTFFNPLLSLPSLPLHRLTTVKLNGILAIDDCIEILRRCDNITRFVVNRLESVQAVLPAETQAFGARKQLNGLRDLELVASDSVDIRRLLEQVDFSFVTRFIFDIPSYDSLMTIIEMPWRRVAKARLRGPANETLQEACRGRGWTYSIPQTRDARD